MDVPNRSELERKLARRVGRELRGEVNDIVDLLTETPSINDIPAGFWAERGSALSDILTPLLSEIFVFQVSAEAVDLGVEVDWQLINRRAADWARNYTFELVRELTDTSRTLLQDSIASYFENEWTRGDLIDKLIADFGPVRAERIAVTEVTRAASAGEEGLREELERAGIHMDEFWHTNNDELVCEICGPLDMTRRGVDWNEPPPAHVNCRCFTGLEIIKNG